MDLRGKRELRRRDAAMAGSALAEGEAEGVNHGLRSAFPVLFFVTVVAMLRAHFGRGAGGVGREVFGVIGHENKEIDRW